MSPQKLINLIASIASLILSVLAIALSLFFYKEAKNAEGKSELALKGIKTQTQSLENLTAKWMDRLTKYATTPKQADETTSFLFTIIKEFTSNRPAAQMLPSPEEDPTTQNIITNYIAIYYYTAVANVALQNYLPPIEDLVENPNAKNLLDTSYNDFNALERLLGEVDKSVLAKNALNSLYEITVEQWKPHVKDSTMVYVSRGNA